jgi:hypothetical protein
MDRITRRYVLVGDEVLVRIAAGRSVLFLAGDEQDWPDGRVVTHYEPIDADDPRVTDEIRARFAWLLW